MRYDTCVIVSTDRNLVRELSAWDAADSTERARAAATVARRLSPPWRLRGLETHELSGVRHEIPVFDHGGVAFALLPGYTGALGYRHEMAQFLDETARTTFRDQLTEFGLDDPPTIEAYLTDCLTERRRVRLDPFLVEVVAQDWSGLIDADGDIADAMSMVCAGGFVLPTIDQWEYACAGGVDKLFRWGDAVPDTDPYVTRGWEIHRQPNAFGLHMTHDTYQMEATSEGRLKGGDGGEAVCGGAAAFATWTPLSSWFAGMEIEEALDGVKLDEILWRRVWRIS